MVLLYTGILLNHKSEQNNATDSSTDGQSDDLTKQRKSERERQISQGITDRYILEMNANFRHYTRETDTNLENKLVIIKKKS